MTITKEELSNIQTDPMVAVSLVLDKLEEANNDIMVVDPANPFAFMLETIAFNSAVLRDEINTKYARVYAKLANDESDLYNNMSYLDFKSTFAQPADAIIRFEVNITNFVNNAITSPNGEFKMVSIPEGSTITAEGYSFLVANRIDIKQFSNGLFSVEQNVSNSSVGVSTLGILPHSIIRSSDENNMLVFDTILKQLTNIELEYTIKKSDSFKIEVPLNNDRLYFISANTTNNGMTVPVSVSYSEVIDPSIPTIIVKYLTNSVEIYVPDVYIISDLIIGKLNISIYTTKGEVDYPLNLLDSKQFIVKYNNTTLDDYTSIISKVSITASSIERLTGGLNGKTFRELRDNIINNAMGDNSSPTTDKQLIASLHNDGFQGYLLADTITNRTYIASRTLIPTVEQGMLNANPDILFYRTKIIPSEFTNHSMVITSTDSDDKLIIKPNTLFKIVNNVVTPLSMTEINSLNSMSLLDKVGYLNNTKIVYSPYSYISSIENGVYYLRIIDYTPYIKSSSIKTINSNVLARINIQSYTIKVIDDGYDITFKMINNSEFEKLDKTIVRAQLKLDLGDGNYIYYQTNYDNGYFNFRVNTNFYADKDFKVLITNGESELATKYLNLNNIVELSTYIIDSDLEVNSELYINDLIYGVANSIVLTHEEVDVVLGTIIDKVYKNMFISYTDRKYLTFDETVYARYDSDIYDTDSIGSLLTPNGSMTEVEYTKLHSKGDIILDENNQPIILHNEGDIILDENNQPIIDRVNGVIKFMDTLMLEYSYLYSNPNKIPDILDSIKSYSQDLREYDKVLLEETSIYFRPFRTNNGVKLKYNNSFRTVHSDLKPEVVLYVDKVVNLTESELLKLKNNIGAILHKYLNDDIIYTVDIRETIKAQIPLDLVAVGVKLDSNDDYLIDAEKIVLHDNSNRLAISKYLTTALGGVNIIYDVKVTIRKI